MTTRNALFQVHWFLGITAGIVLALVGVTGGLLSFEDELLKAWNPGVMTVEARGTPLSPDALVARIREQRPDDRIQSLAISHDAGNAARVGFAPTKGAASGPGGRGPRGESRYVNPYTGELLGKPKGEGFFRTTMQLHRWLAMDDVGKQIVAFATVALIFFCLSGLYLRWPRRWRSLRTWFTLDWMQKGRNFLWHLHSIVGTWVLIAYLIMSFTGLWWSYGWYRDAVNRWADMPSQQQPRGEGPRAGANRAEGGEKPKPVDVDVTAAWAAFQKQVPAWSTATLQWPRDGGDVQFRYLDAKPAHERANNTLELDPATLDVVKHERYDDRPWKQKIAGSMFALHRGSFFGLAGVIIFMIASLLMPLFAITGWMLYLDRRKRQREAKRLAAAAPTPASGADGERTLIAYASQTGNAQRLAWQTAMTLNAAGIHAEVKPLSELRPDNLDDYDRVLFVVSTFGESQPPDNGRAFARRMRAMQPGSLRNLRYGILSLGDSEYGDDYSGFGRELDHWLHVAGAEPLFDRIDVDAMDEGALRHWQHNLGVMSGHTDMPDWTAPQYQHWTLAERRLLNPGSPGGAAYHIGLTPPPATTPKWQAGDIIEIGPRHSPVQVAQFLAATGLGADEAVTVDGHQVSLRDLLARSLLPDAGTVRGLGAEALASTLKPLPHREYSIASLPTDGEVQFILRRMLLPDGSPGLASGWLCDVAPIGGDIDARLRSNPNFHAPDPARPMILIGNGTGIGGLRAHLKARVAAGAHRNWMLFGERSASADRLYGDELEGWLQSGALTHLDRVFSREDVGGPRYVQDALRANIGRLREWLSDGASVYVCGSLKGMAPGVDAMLVEAIGQAGVDALIEAGCYRRDVY